VSDTGIGIAPQDIPIALAPFGQIDNALRAPLSASTCRTHD